jgi:hypothetical protein
MAWINWFSENPEKVVIILTTLWTAFQEIRHQIVASGAK